MITLLDVQHLDLPELFPRGERLFRKLAYDRAARKATEVIVISEFVRERVVERLGLDPDHVHAVWLGVDHERFTPTPDVEREPLLLYPARPWPHKNHARLLEAFAAIRRVRPELRLVLTGVGHDRRSLPDGVEARSVSGAELVELYRRAACLVFPSLYEGSGSRPSRRWRAAAPSLRPNVGSLPEVCGDAAVLFDPLDPEAIAAGVDEALTRSAELSERGLRRAATFTWDEHGPRARPDLRDVLAEREPLELRIDEQPTRPSKSTVGSQPRRCLVRVGSPTRWCSSARPAPERRVAADVLPPVEPDVRRTRARRAPARSGSRRSRRCSRPARPAGA